MYSIDLQYERGRYARLCQRYRRESMARRYGQGSRGSQFEYTDITTFHRERRLKYAMSCRVFLPKERVFRNGSITVGRRVPRTVSRERSKARCQDIATNVRSIQRKEPRIDRFMSASLSIAHLSAISLHSATGDHLGRN